MTWFFCSTLWVLGIEHQALGQLLLPCEHLIYLNLDFKNCLTIIAWFGGEEKARKNLPQCKMMPTDQKLQFLEMFSYCFHFFHFPVSGSCRCSLLPTFQ